MPHHPHRVTHFVHYWLNPAGQLAHPYSPAGGSGGGAASMPGHTGALGDPTDELHPLSPAGKHAPELDVMRRCAGRLPAHIRAKSHARRSAAPPTPLQPAATLATALTGLRGDGREINLDVIKQVQDRGSQDCFKLACEMADHGNRGTGKSARLMGRDGRIQVAVAEDADGRVVVDPVKALDALNYIDRALQAGVRVVVGASYSTKGTRSNPDTEHFLTVYGRSRDASGRVFYRFMDPGLSYRDGTEEAKSRLYVDAVTWKMFRLVSFPGHSSQLLGREYNVTQVRTYDRLPSER